MFVSVVKCCFYRWEKPNWKQRDSHTRKWSAVNHRTYFIIYLICYYLFVHANVCTYTAWRVFLGATQRSGCHVAASTDQALRHTYHTHTSLFIIPRYTRLTYSMLAMLYLSSDTQITNQRIFAETTCVCGKYNKTIGHYHLGKSLDRS